MSTTFFFLAKLLKGARHWHLILLIWVSRERKKKKQLLQKTDLSHLSRLPIHSDTGVNPKRPLFPLLYDS